MWHSGSVVLLHHLAQVLLEDFQRRLFSTRDRLVSTCVISHRDGLASYVPRPILKTKQREGAVTDALLR